METHTSAPPRPLERSSSLMRSFITPAALFVNVTARIACGRHALFDQMRHAIRDHARLARARAREHEQGPFGREHSFALALVQPGEKLRCVWGIAQAGILADENQLGNFDRTGSLSGPFIFTAA